MRNIRNFKCSKEVRFLGSFLKFWDKMLESLQVLPKKPLNLKNIL